MAKPAAPKGLRAGGKALWSDLASEGMSQSTIALLTEACRARDRLDQLDRVLTGDVDTWCDIATDYLGEPIKLNISPALDKANATATTLRLLLAQLAPAAAALKPAAKPAGSKSGGGTALDQLAERREQRGPARAATTRARTAERRRPRK